MQLPHTHDASLTADDVSKRWHSSSPFPARWCCSLHHVCSLSTHPLVSRAPCSCCQVVQDLWHEHLVVR